MLRHFSFQVAIYLSVTISILSAQAQIAVVDFEALGVSINDARALTNRLMIEMHRTNKFKVLEREMLDKVIEEQKFQLSGCNADQCLVELGQLANVQQIVGGTISKVGRVFSISARLIGVESGEIIESALLDYEGNIGELMKTGMANVASQLAGTQIQDISKETPTLKSDKSTNKSPVQHSDDKGSIRWIQKQRLQIITLGKGFSEKTLNNYLQHTYGCDLSNLTEAEAELVMQTFVSENPPNPTAFKSSTTND